MDSKGQDSMEEIPISVRQRRERIAARTAKAKIEGGDIQRRDSPKPSRSLSPGGKRSAKPSPPARSAFGSSVSQTGDAKPRVKPSMDKKDIKSTTQVTRKGKSSPEVLKDRTASEVEASKISSRNRLDSKLVAGHVEKIAAIEPWSKAKGASEVAERLNKRAARGVSNDQSNSALPVDVDTVGPDKSFENNLLEDPCRESMTDSCSESLEITLERSRNGSPINVMSPTYSLFESRRSNSSRHSSRHSSESFYDIQERYESKLEDPELQTDSDAALYTDLASSDVSMSREPQIEEVRGTLVVKLPLLLLAC